jgi:hypothetical protein
VLHLTQKSFKHLKTASKVTASVFWDKGGILLVYYLKKSTTITASLSDLDKVKQVLVSKQRRNLSKGVLFLQDTTSLTHSRSWLSCILKC